MAMRSNSVWKRHFQAAIFLFNASILTIAIFNSPVYGAPFQAKPKLSIAEDVFKSEGNNGATVFNFTVKVSSPLSQSASAIFITADGTAKAGSDYSSVSTRVTFNPGGPTSLTVQVTVNGDAAVEADEFFSVDLLSAVNAVIELPSRKKGVIINDDGAGALPALTINEVRSAEGNAGSAAFRFNVTLSSAINKTVSVNFTTVDGNTRAGEDYQRATGVLNIAAGSTSQSIVVNVIGDLISEADEVFFVALSNPINAKIPAGSERARGVILNDDGESTPRIAINDLKLVEGNSTGKAVFTVSLSQRSLQTVTVNFATANGTATAGSDYTAASGKLTFAVGEITKTIAVGVNGDVSVEPDETFALNLLTPVNATISKGQGTAVLINDDGGGLNLPTLSIEQIRIRENDLGSNFAAMNVTLSRASQQTVLVDFATAKGTATAGSDYEDVKGTLTFPPGTTTQTVKVKVFGDDVVEPDESFFVVLSNFTNALASDGRGAVLIVNDDGGGLPNISIGDIRINEGNSGTAAAAFPVTLSAASKQPVTVTFATADGTARSGVDYVSNRGTITFQPGATSQNVSVAVNGESTAEPDETLFVVLTNPVNAAIGKGRAVGVIVADDGAQLPPTLQFSNPNYRVSENGAKAEITVVRTGNSSGKVSVGFATRNGSALANTSYSPVVSTIVFNDKDMSPKTVVIPILDNKIVEEDKALKLVLSNPKGGAKIGLISAATLTIDDDDTSANPVLRVVRTVDFGSVASNQTAARAVRIANAGGGTLNFALSLASGADAGFSFKSQSSTGVLKAGETATFTVAFDPARDGLSTGSIAVTSNGGNAAIRLLASSDSTPPDVILMSPAGGETIAAGRPFNILFTGSDEELAGFLVSFSTDGGATFADEIARLGPDETSVVWNVPSDLDASQAVIQVAARDRSGNVASDISGVFTVSKPQTNATNLQVVLTFDPPDEDQLAPPQNFTVSVTEAESASNSTMSGAVNFAKKKIRTNVDAAPTDVIGYNIYRAAVPNDGSPSPEPDEITGDPNNLIGSTTGDSISFMDTASTGNSNNFVYAATSFFGNGQQSGGSNTASTDLPVIKNPVFQKGTIFMDSAGSFIAVQGAILIVGGKESYPLMLDGSASRFTVSKKTASTPGGLIPKKLIGKGSAVQLIVKNPDGKISLAATLTRTK